MAFKNEELVHFFKERVRKLGRTIGYTSLALLAFVALSGGSIFRAALIIIGVLVAALGWAFVKASKPRN